MEGNIHVSDLRWSQLRAVADVISVLAVVEVTAVLRNVPCTRFGCSQLRRVTGTQTDSAVRNILLVIGYGQGNSFGSAEFRMIT